MVIFVIFCFNFELKKTAFFPHLETLTEFTLEECYGTTKKRRVPYLEGLHFLRMFGYPTLSCGSVL
jgi:hypothetical protein